MRATDGLASESSYNTSKTRFYLKATVVLTRNGVTIATVTNQTQIVPPFQFVDLPVGNGSGAKKFVSVNTILAWDGRAAGGTCLADGSLDARVDVEFIREKDTGSGTKTRETDRAGSLSTRVSILGVLPSLSITSPATGTITREASVTVSGAVSTLLPVAVKVNAQPASLTNGSFSTAVSLAEGPTQITASATDCAGRTTSRSIQVVRDSIPPTVRIEAPAEGAFERTATPPVRISYADAGTGIAVGSVRIVISGVDRTADFHVGTSGATLKPGVTLGLADGPHQVVATVEDVAHNQGQATTSFVVDMTSPALSLSPINATVLPSGQVTFVATHTDTGSGLLLTSLSATLDGQAISFAAGAAQSTFTPSPHLADGSHSLSVTILDRAGNSTTAQTTVLVDSQAPTISVAPADGSFINNAKSMLRVTYSDPVPSSGLDLGSLEIRVDGAIATGQFTVTDAEATFTPATPLAEGVHTITGTIRDRAGHSSGAASSTFTVDTIAPTLTVSPVAGSVLASGRVTFVADYSDASSGALVSSFTGTLDGQPAAFSAGVGQASFAPDPALSDGSHTVVVSIQDRAGNSATAQTSVFVDSRAPTISVTPADGSFTNNAKALLRVSYSDPEPSAGLDLGSLEVKVDNVAATGQFTISGSDATFTPASPLSDGPHTIIAVIKDRASHSSGTATSTFTVDTVAPSLALSPASGTFVASSTPELVGTYEDANLLTASFTATLNGLPVSFEVGASRATFTTGSLDIATSHALVVRIADRAGNLTEKTTTFQVDIADPVIALVPPSGSVVSSGTTTITIGFSDVGSGVQPGAARLVLDGTDRTGDLVVAVSQASLSVQLQDGTHTALGTVTDRAGRQGTASSTFIVDSHPPNLTIVQPSQGESLTTTLPRFEVTFADPGGSGIDVSSFRATISGVDRTAAFAITQTGATLQSAGSQGFLPGNHTFIAEVADKAGHRTSRQVTFSISQPSAGPFITLSPPDGVFVTSPAYFEINFRSRDSAVVSTSVSLSVDGLDYSDDLYVQPLFADFELDLPDGPHSATATVADVSGQVATVSSRFVVDSVYPEIQIVQPSDGEMLATTSPMFIVRFSDVGSGLDLSKFSAYIRGRDRTADFSVTTTGARFQVPPGAGLVPGYSDLRVEIADKAENYVDTQVAFAVPGAAVTLFPADGSSVPGPFVPVTVSFESATSQVEPGTFRLQVDGVDQTTELFESGISATAFLDLTDGSHTISGSAKDTSGRVLSATARFQVDSHRPTIEILQPFQEQTLSTTTPLFAVRFADEGLGLDLSTFSANIGGQDRTAEFTVTTTGATFQVPSGAALRPGSSSFNVSVQDKAGNWASSYVSFQVLGAGRDLVVVGPADGFASPTRTVTVTGFAFGESPTLTINGQPVTVSRERFEHPFELQDGRNDLLLDLSTLDGGRQWRYLTVFYDITAPVLTIAFPSSPFIAERSFVFVTGRVDDAGPVRLRIAGQDVPLDPNGVFGISVNLQEGAVTIPVCASDEAGNATVRVLRGIYDAHPPTLANLTPADGATFLMDPIDVSGAVLDATKVVVTVNGVTATVTNSAFSARVPLVQGQNTLTIVAVDEAGNQATATRRVTLDLKQPSISILEPADGSTVTTDTPDIFVTYHNGESGIDRQTFSARLNNEDITSAFSITDSSASWRVSRERALTAGQTYVLECRVFDRAGRDSTARCTFRVGSGPQPPAVTPSSGYACGRVFDGATGAPLDRVEITVQDYSGTVLSREDGRYEIPSPGPGEYFINIGRAGYTVAQRRVRIVAGRESAVRPAHLVRRSPKVRIEAATGGTVTDPTGRIVLTIPPGALHEDTDIQVTDLPRAQVLPAELPPQSDYLSAFEIEPSMRFATPVRLRYRMRTDAPMPEGTLIPLGHFAVEKGHWCHETQARVLADGFNYEVELSHASAYDGNPRGRRIPPEPKPGDDSDGDGIPDVDDDDDDNDGIKDVDEDNADLCDCKCASSSYKDTLTSGFCMDTGAFEEEHLLENGLRLVYRSDTVDPRPLVDVRAVIDSFLLGPELASVSADILIGSQFHEVFYQRKDGRYAFRWLWNATNARGEKVQTGSYPYRVRLSHHYTGLRYADTPIFGDAGRGIIPGPVTVEPVRRSVDVVGRVGVVNRRTSALGAGWGVAGVSRVHVDPDGPILLEEGTGTRKVFTPADVLYTSYADGPVTTLVAVDSASRQLITSSTLPSADPVFPNRVLSVAPNADRTGVFVSTTERDIYELGPPTHRLRHIYRHPGLGRPNFSNVRVAAMPDANKLFVAISQRPDAGQLELFDLTTKTTEVLLARDESLRRHELSSIVPTPDGRRVYVLATTTSSEASTCIFMTVDLTVRPVVITRTEYPTTSFGVGQLVLSPDGKLGAVINGNLHFVDLSGGSPVFVGSLPGPFNSTAFTPDGQRLITAGQAGVFLYNLGDVFCGINGNVTLGTPTEGGFGQIAMAPDGESAYVVGPPMNLASGSKAGQDRPPFSVFGRELYHVDLLEPSVTPLIPQVRMSKQGSAGLPGPAAIIRSRKHFVSPAGEPSSLSAIDGGGWIRQFERGKTIVFDSAGLQRERRMAGGRTWRYDYDSQLRLTSITHPEAEGVTQFRYGSNGIESIVSPSGRETTLQVTGGQLVSITSPGTAPRRFGYDSALRMTNVDDPAGHSSTISYDSNGHAKEVVARGEIRHQLIAQNGQGLANHLSEASGDVLNPLGELVNPKLVMARYTGPDGGSWIHQMNAFSQIILSVDPFGHMTRRTFDARGRITSQVDPLNRRTQYGHSEEGLLTSVRHPTGEVVSATPVRIGEFVRIGAVSQPSGATTTVQYSALALPTKFTDPLSHATVIEYAGSRPSRIQTPTGRSIFIDRTPFGAPSTVSLSASPSREGAESFVFSYDANRNLVLARDPLGHETRATFDAAGRPQTITDPANGVTQIVYDDAGRPSTVTAPGGRTTSLVWGPHGIASSTNPLSHQTKTEYTASGKIKKISNFRGEATSVEYDTAGRPVAWTDPAGGRRQIKYDEAHDVAELIDPLARSDTFARDDRRRLTQWTHPDGTVTRWSYFADGPVASVTDESGHTLRIERDAAMRAVALVDPTGARTKLDRDADGRVVRRTSRRGIATDLTYDGLGRLSTIKLPGGVTYTLIYDPVGNLVEIKTAKGGRWIYPYDGKRRVTSFKDPLGAEWHYGYDAADNLERIDEPGDAGTRLVTTVTYDLLRRPLTIRAPDRQWTFSYMDASNAVQVALSPEGITVEKNFDALGRVVREHVSGPHSSLVDYEWTSTSRLSRVRLEGVLALSYGYDRRDRLTSIRDERRNRSFTLSYTQRGELASVQFPGGVRKVHDWGSRGELRSITYQRDSSTILRRVYSHDAELRITAISDDLGTLVQYQYDDRDQLLRADYRGGGFESWTYDPNGNIATYQTNGGFGARSESRQHDAADGLSRIDSVGVSGVATVTTFTLDGRGNVVRQSSSDGEVRELSWDSQNWLNQVKQNGQVKLEATYLDDYRLATLKDGDETSAMAWMGGNILSEHVGGMEKVFNVALLGLDENIETGPPAGPRETLVTDQVESWLASLDDTGEVVRAAQSGAYGELRLGPDPGRIGFAGARRHQATGLSWMRNRWYDPKLGRFLSRDPIGFAGGWNPYAYAGNSPAALRDPIGLKLYFVGTQADRASLFQSLSSALRSVTISFTDHGFNDEGLGVFEITGLTPQAGIDANAKAIFDLVSPKVNDLIKCDFKYSVLGLRPDEEERQQFYNPAGGAFSFAVNTSGQRIPYRYTHEPASGVTQVDMGRSFYSGSLFGMSTSYTRPEVLVHELFHLWEFKTGTDTDLHSPSENFTWDFIQLYRASH